jgi:hypothetical protein
MRIFGSFQFLGRRSVPRTRAPLVATVSTLMNDRRMVLIDICRTGASVGGVDLPEVAEQVVFSAEGVQAFGEVVRSETDKCAIEFSTPIATQEVCRLRRLARFEPEQDAA